MSAIRHPLLVALALMAVAVAACAPGVTPSAPSSGPAASASPVAPPSAVSPSAVPSASTGVPSASTTASAEGSPEPSGAGPGQCTVQSSTGALPSDRLVSVRVGPGPRGYAVAFVFGPASSPPSPTSPQGAVEDATPPFTLDPSGLPLAVAGQRFVRVRFEGLTLYDDSGTPTYGGPDRLEGDPGDPVLEVAKESEFEGISSWIIGYDGTSCPILASDLGGSTISLIFPTS
jgi:hypothetical protein